MIFLLLYIAIVSVIIEAKFYSSKNFPDCFGVLCKNNGTLDPTTCTCQCTEGKGGYECEKDLLSAWSDDDFALPESLYGCPEPDSDLWKQAIVTLIISGNYLPETKHIWPDFPHFRTSLHRRNVSLNFCVRNTLEKSKGNGSHRQSEDLWPPGNYCFYKEHPCSEGLAADTLVLDGYMLYDSSIPMTSLRFIKSHNNSERTVTELAICCKNAGEALHSIALPQKYPFIFIKGNHSDGCQSIKDTEVKEEWFSFVQQPRTLQTTGGPAALTYGKDNLNISYCFYKSTARSECYHITDKGASYRGRLNVTRQGLACLPWKDIAGLENSNILEENFCRKVSTRRNEIVGCYAGVATGTYSLLDCILIPCDEGTYIHTRFPNVAYHRPVSSNIPGDSLMKLVNGMDWRGSEDFGIQINTRGTKSPWVRLDLGTRYNIYGVALYRGILNCEYPNKWTNVAIWIHDYSEQFHSFGAHLCWEIEDFLSVCNIELRCVQPMAGRFVTVQAYVSASSGYVQPPDTYASFEEIEVYGQATECGQYFGFGTTDIVNMQAIVSNGKPAALFNLFSGGSGGCFKTSLFVTIDLLALSSIEGIAAWITSNTSVSVTAHHGRQEAKVSREDNMVFHAMEPSHIQSKFFNHSIFVRFLNLTFSSIRPDMDTCLKIDLIGCPKRVLRDPACINEKESIGVIEESRKKIALQSDTLHELQYSVSRTDVASCRSSCVGSESCLSYFYNTSSYHCNMYTSSLYKKFGGIINGTTDTKLNALKKVADDLGSVGEKICIGETRMAHPCHYELNFIEGMIVTSPSYPVPYETNLRCSWRIELQKSSSVKVSFLDIEMAKPEENDQKNASISCVDVLSVGVTQFPSSDGPHLVLTHANASSFEKATSFLPESEYLYINFITCARKAPSVALGFAVKFEISDCPGCQNTYSTCSKASLSSSTECIFSDCGYISTFNLYDLYEKDRTCQWVVNITGTLKLEFLYFDIPGGENCTEDSLDILSGRGISGKNLSNSDDWATIGRYCNENRPKSILYMNTALGVKLSSNNNITGTGTGTGFLIRYSLMERNAFEGYTLVSMATDSLKVLKANGINTIGKQIYFDNNPNYHFCETKGYPYQMFLEYPFKCFLSANVIDDQPTQSWIEAREKCTEYGGRLLTVENDEEENLMKYFLLQSQSNNTFIGFQRNHSTNLLYDSLGRKSFYMNWGFDNDAMTVEPNGLEENTCLMIRDFLYTSGIYKEDNWADVSCYQKIDAYIICEKVPVFPWEVETNVNSTGKNMNRGIFEMENENLLKCDNGEYILRELRCDGRSQCLDASDEVNCDYNYCPPDMFYCGNKERRCININLTCDFNYDCDNGADEKECVYPDCKEGEWQCLNGQCIPTNARNDKKFDCPDHSDETKDGYDWTITIQTSNVFDGGISANVFLKIYSDNDFTYDIFLDKMLYKIVEGSETVIATAFNMTKPYRIRVRHDGAPAGQRWYLEKIILENDDFGSFVFDCNCVIPEVTSVWRPEKDIAVSSQDSGFPTAETNVYIIKVRTGQSKDAGTLNKVFVQLFGETADSGIFELRLDSADAQPPFQPNQDDEFIFETIDLDSLHMINVYHFGPHLDDEWLLEDISVMTSSFNESLIFPANRWLGINIAQSDFAVTLLPEDVAVETKTASKKCPESMFQCTDGHCIPSAFYCDHIVHCHGPFHEDEPLICSPKHLRTSCREYLVNAQQQEGIYKLSLGNVENQFEIHCAFGKGDLRGSVGSYVHHNLESWTGVTRFTTFPVNYTINDVGIELLKNTSEKCLQRIEISCEHSYGDEIISAITWTGSGGEKLPFIVNNNASCNEIRCKCQMSRSEWFSSRFPEAFVENLDITDIDKLPVKSVAVGMEMELPTKLRLRVGPLECYQSIDKKNIPHVCKNGEIYNKQKQCILEYDAFRRILGCKDFSHIAKCEEFRCPDGYIKCPSSFCIPLHYVCNGQPDCRDGEDEKKCDEHNTCRGALRCRNQNVCVASGSICDGKKDCLLGDDEMHCHYSKDKEKSLSLKGYYNDSDIHGFADFPLLASLNMSGAQISNIDVSTFKGLKNLLVLDLGNNILEVLSQNEFSDLSRLKVLFLHGNNYIRHIEPGAFHGLGSLTELNLTNMKISTVFTGTFDGLHSLQKLNLSVNSISSLEDNAFEGLSNLKSLDLRGNKIKMFSSKAFAGLDSLEQLWSDLYLLCCIRPSTVTEDNCFPEQNEFSSCDDLMTNEMLRAFVWIIGVIALLGNAFSVIFRAIREQNSFRTGNGVLLTNLCIADFLMGVYMIIIGSADVTFRGKYVWNDIAWRNGWLCNFAGFLAFLSCEVSGAFLCLITFDRLVTIRFTLQRVGFTKTKALYTCLVLWGICIGLGLLPFLRVGYFDEEFYTRSGVCLALPLTTDRRGGWEYAIAIFVFLNFFMFVFIAVGQFLLFREIRKAHMAMEGKQRRDDVVIARKLSLVVMTNFFCWFPITIMGLMALSGTTINSEVYAWVAVFVLPLNSATNPILYTLSSLFTSDFGKQLWKKLLLHRKNKTLTEAEEETKLQKLFQRNLICLNWRPNTTTLAKYSDDSGLTCSVALAITRRLALTLEFLHSLGYVAGPFTCDEVILGINRHGKIRSVGLLALPIYSNSTDDASSDVASLGFVVRRMIENQKKIRREEKKGKSQTSFRGKVTKFFGTQIKEAQV